MGGTGVLVALVAACAGSPPAGVAAPPAPAPVASGGADASVPAASGTVPEAPVRAGSTSSGTTTAVSQGQRGVAIPPDLSDVEHMCALLTACEKLPVPPSLVAPDFAGCVAKMSAELASPSALGFSLLMRECGLQSSSCAALKSCALRGADPAACAGRGKQAVVGFCDVDGRALACWHEQVLAVRDCPRGGEQCIVVDGQATCTLGACPATVAEGAKPQCSASARHLMHCEKGKLASLDCAAFGLKCLTGADGTAACASAGPACAAGAKRCEGTSAVGCYDGHEARVDCGAASMTCAAPASGAAAAEVGACYAAPPAAGACDPAERGKCEGASVKYCHAGTPRTYPCKALGFNRCEALASGGGVRCAM
ncbi:MAG: hypothetical protein ACRENE_27585 [Polyangiaceae bacterium]